jgi:DNA-directed RNA polymerase subunit M/transcription elongation factor TFIIS
MYDSIHDDDDNHDACGYYQQFYVRHLYSVEKMIFKQDFNIVFKMESKIIDKKNHISSRTALLSLFNTKDTQQIEELIEKKILREKFCDMNICYTRYVYMIIGEALKGINSKTIIESLRKEANLGWNHPVFYSVTCRIKEQDDFILKPFEVEEGVIECRCGSKRVFSYSKQSRSADEPMSTYAQCMVCKAKWVYSG